MRVCTACLYCVCVKASVLIRDVLAPRIIRRAVGPRRLRRWRTSSWHRLHSNDSVCTTSDWGTAWEDCWTASHTPVGLSILTVLTFDAAKTVVHCPGVYSVSPGLVQLTVVWCAGVPAAESPVGAKRRHPSTYQHTAPWPHHSSCCVNFIGCRSRDEWNLRLRVSYTDRSRQRRQRTCLSTFDSSPSTFVLISVHLLTEHWLFHGCALASVTEVSPLPDRACGTLCRLRCDRWQLQLRTSERAFI